MPSLGRSAWQPCAPAATCSLCSSHLGRVPRPAQSLAGCLQYSFTRLSTASLQPLPSSPALAGSPWPWGPRGVISRSQPSPLPALLQLAEASQHPAHNCHRAKGNSSRATTRSLLGQNNPSRAPGRAVHSLEGAWLSSQSPALAPLELPGDGNHCPCLSFPTWPR